MESIQLKPSELIGALLTAIRADLVPIVMGPPGIGKTQINGQAAARLGMRFTPEIASIMDLTDWRGVPDVDRKAGRTIWHPPAFLPGPEDPPTLVFLDDITQCPPQCQPPMYQLLCEGRIGTVWKRPPETRFAAAGNSVHDRTFAQELGSALRDRMILLYLKADLDEWCVWAVENGVPDIVIAFVRFRPNLLYSFDPDEWCSPTLRGWEQVGRIVRCMPQTGIDRDALLQGAIGIGAAREFASFEQVYSELPDLDSVLRHPEQYAVPTRPELRYALASGIASRASVESMPRVMRVLQRLDAEYRVFALRAAVRRDPALEATPEYTQWLIENASTMW